MQDEACRVEFSYYICWGTSFELTLKVSPKRFLGDCSVVLLKIVRRISEKILSWVLLRVSLLTSSRGLPEIGKLFFFFLGFVFDFIKEINSKYITTQATRLFLNPITGQCSPYILHQERRAGQLIIKATEDFTAPSLLQVIELSKWKDAHVFRNTFGT